MNSHVGSSLGWNHDCKPQSEQPNPLGPCLTVCSRRPEHIQTTSTKCFRCLDTICSVRASLGQVSARICHMLPWTHVSPVWRGGERRSVVSQLPREQTPAGSLTVEASSESCCDISYRPDQKRLGTNHITHRRSGNRRDELQWMVSQLKGFFRWLFKTINLKLKHSAV